MKKITIKKKVHYSLRLLFGVGIFALFLIFISCNDNKKEDQGETDTKDVISVQENNNTVAAYVTFIQADTNKMSLDHVFTNEALLKLTSATGAMADEIDYRVKGDLDKAKEYAGKIVNDPFETSHADDIKKAADILTNVLQNMQQAKYPTLSNEITELKTASAAINPETLTLDQRDAVKSFFAKAADLLQKMN